MGILPVKLVSSIVFVLFIQVIEADEQISRTSTVNQIYLDDHPAADWAGDSNPYNKNSYYPQQYPQNKDYGYYPPPGGGKPSKGKDGLWEFFENLFDKKNELEEEIFDLIFHKEEEKGHHYGEPPSGYHGDHKNKPLSKEKIYEKIKFLAIASTVLLIVLGGGILLAPLAIGKGRSLAEFFPARQNEIAQLASNVLQAIQQYQQQQQQQTIWKKPKL